MAVTGKPLAAGTLTTSAATYYTAQAAVRTRIDAFSVCNYSASAATFTIHLVPSGGSAGPSNILVSARSIAAGASARVPEAVNQWLSGGGTIQALASAGGAVTITVAGVEQTAN